MAESSASTGTDKNTIKVPHAFRRRLLPVSFYRNEDVVSIARSLLGTHIYTLTKNHVTGGIITETEAYAGTGDRASHAYGGRRTARTETMYAPGGIAYVYLCYGMHALLNVVTGPRDLPHAVLIRAISPMTGLPVIQQRRGTKIKPGKLAAGPGTLTQALGITVKDNAADLRGTRIWITRGNAPVDPQQITAGPRVGIDYAGADALRPWRFRLTDQL